MKDPKFFTIEEADQLIGLLETTIERIKRNKQQFLWLQEELNVLHIIVSCGASEKNRDALELDGKKKKFKELARQIEKDINVIEGTGCVLRDVDRGVVDFYSIQDGSVVFLCWKKGEGSVRHWHTIRDGFDGRQRLMRSPSKR